MIPSPPDADDFQECECCGEMDFNIHAQECDNCGWKMPDATEEYNLCYSCGATKHPSFFLSPNDDSCTACVADEMKVKRQGELIHCGTCKRMRPSDMYSETTTDGEFICMACEVKR